MTMTLSGAARTATADAMAPLPYRVADHRTETADTVTLTLMPVESHQGLARFRPGQFTMLSVRGVGEIPVSISGNPSDQHDGRLVQTVRAVGAVSAALCRSRVGATVGVRGPYGRGWNLATACGGDLLVAAGGIGLAPLRPLIMAALENRDRFGRFDLLVGARARTELLYPLQLDSWARSGAVTVEATLDRAGAGWTGRVGLITGPLAETPVDPDRATAFLCGPEVMIRACADALTGRGLAAERIQVSLERNMKCGIGWCGRCQLGPLVLCRRGPVVGYDAVGELLAVEEL